jgi:N-acetyltransferase
LSVQNAQPRFVASQIKPMRVQPVTLEGQYVRLEPLSMEHHAGLSEVALDEDLWRWIPVQVRTPDEMRMFIELALKLQAEGSVLPFATISKSENRVIGSSRYLNIDHAHHRLEIGSTVVAKEWQRTRVNTEAKFLMLRHAFESLGCIRVEFKTDSLNEKSRNALLRIGATQEGIFRNHIICANGRIRHSVYFSITDEEWTKTIKPDLEAKLARAYP